MCVSLSSVNSQCLAIRVSGFIVTMDGHVPMGLDQRISYQWVLSTATRGCPHLTSALLMRRVRLSGLLWGPEGKYQASYMGSRAESTVKTGDGEAGPGWA